MFRIKFIVTLGFAILMFVGCSSDRSLKYQYQVERMFLRANKLYQKVLINPQIASDLDYHLAASAYEKVLTKLARPYSESVKNVRKQSYLNLAQLSLLQGEMRAAIKAYDAFLQEFPDDIDLGLQVRLADAECNERIFNLYGAANQYQDLIGKFGPLQDPLKPNLQILRLPLKVARLENTNQSESERSDSYKSAMIYYRSILQKWPNSPAAFYALYYMASIYADQQKQEKAAHILKRIVEEYPERKEIPKVLFTLGNLYLDFLKMPNRAVEIFETVLVKYPDDDIRGYAYFSKARALVQKKNYEAARPLLHWIIENFPDDSNLGASAQLTIGYTYEKEGKWDRALVEYRWVQEEYPITVQGLQVPIYISQYYRRKGETQLSNNAFQQAVEQYVHLVQKYPKTMLAGVAQEYIIYCYSAQNKWQKAAEAANSLRQIYPSSQSNISSYLLLGQIYERLKQYQNAIAIYERFVKEYPQHPLITQIESKIKALQRG